MTPRRAGPAAWFLDPGTEPGPDTARRLRVLAERLRASAPGAVRDLIPGYGSLLVESRPGTPRARILAWLRAAEEGDAGGATPVMRRHEIPVHYGHEADRDALERRLGLPFERIAALHREAAYTVAFLGFTPGFPYLLGLPAALETARRDTPRARVPAGAVAIAGAQAGIYPSPSPGGWWILGTTPTALFDAERWPPSDWAAGDEVRFLDAAGAPAASHTGSGAARGRPRRAGGAGGAEAARAAASAPAPLGDPAAEPAALVEEAWPPSASLQAEPRWWVGHYGMAQAGPLDPLAAEVANAAVGNPGRAPVLELVGLPLRLRAIRTLRAAVAGGGFEVRLETRPQRTGAPFAWPAGAVLELLPSRGAGGAVSYLACTGAFAAQRYAGSRSTDLRAGAGGSRRALQAGDVLGVGGAPSGLPRPAAGPLHYPPRVELRIHPGPQHDDEAFAALLHGSFRVAAGDRTGVRLDGPAVPVAAPDVLSEGSMWGAVQVPADGRPIVLLADRGRTGGYAKPAVVDVRDLWRLAQAGAGSEVWFVAAEGVSAPRRRPG